MSNYIVTATNKDLNDYFYLLTYPTTNTQGNAQISNYKQNNKDLNAIYLPHASANNNTDTGPTGFQYIDTETGTFQDLNKLFAMKITPTITGTRTSTFINNTRQIIFEPGSNTRISFSNVSDTPFRATVIVIGGGGGGANGTQTQTGQGGGGGAIAIGIITLEVKNVIYTATVPASVPAGTNGGDASFVGNGSSIIANGGNAGAGANSGGASTNTVTVSQAAGQDWVASVTANFGGAGGGNPFLSTYNNGTNASSLAITYNNGTTNNTRYYCGGGGSGSKSQGGAAGLNGNGGAAGSNGVRAGGSALSTSYGAGGGGGAEGTSLPAVAGGTGGSGGPGAVIILF
jgi:hypothetical protein